MGKALVNIVSGNVKYGSHIDTIAVHPKNSINHGEHGVHVEASIWGLQAIPAEQLDKAM
jgi:hypothetical protein